MADSKNTTVRGLLAEFDAVEPIKAAAIRVRDAGYTKTDAFTPFAVHGLEKCLGIPPTGLPWISLLAGITGCSLGLLMEIWMNGVDYKYIISGKPFVSLPAFIPVSYELTILLASFGAFFGMLALNGLPKFSNPMFTDPRFDRATDDRFFLYIDASDPRFQEAGVRKLFEEFHPLSISEVREDESPKRIPGWIMTTLGVLGMLALIPPLCAAMMRVTTSDKPRFHVFFEMDFHPKKLTQQTSTLFADGRVMRPPVPGTVARGAMVEDVNFYTGVDVQKLAMIDQERAERLVARALRGDAQEGQEKPAEEKPADEKPAEEPKAEEPKADPPAEDKPAADKPAEEPKAEKPAEEPKGDKPAEEPKADKPAEEPKADKPAEEPKADKPADAPKPDAAADKPKDEPKTDKPAAAAPPAPAVDTTPYLQTIPAKVDESFVMRGQEKFNIYCAPCHGLDGSGNGLVTQRARAILATNWTPPSSLHQELLYQQPDGKIFSTISNGIRKMPGYASQISPEDRWAIVAYVRALQRSRNAKLEDVPTDQRGSL